MPTPTCPPSRTPKWHKHRVRSSEPLSSPRHHLHPLPCDQPCGPKPPGHQGQLFLLPDVPPPLHTRPWSQDALRTPSAPSTPSLHPVMLCAAPPHLQTPGLGPVMLCVPLGMHSSGLPRQPLAQPGTHSRHAVGFVHGRGSRAVRPVNLALSVPSSFCTLIRPSECAEAAWVGGAGRWQVPDLGAPPPGACRCGQTWVPSLLPLLPPLCSCPALPLLRTYLRSPSVGVVSFQIRCWLPRPLSEAWGLPVVSDENPGLSWWEGCTSGPGALEPPSGEGSVLRPPLGATGGGWPKSCFPLESWKHLGELTRAGP